VPRFLSAPNKIHPDEESSAITRHECERDADACRYDSMLAACCASNTLRYCDRKKRDPEGKPGGNQFWINARRESHGALNAEIGD
jgi:hypothetical protein